MHNSWVQRTKIPFGIEDACFESGRGLPHSKTWRKIEGPIAKPWHAGFAFFALVGTLSAQDVAGTFLKGPYLQGPGTDTITIKWESPSSKPGIVHYGLDGKTDLEFSGGTPRPQLAETNKVFLHVVCLTNLRPGSVYTYSAESEGVRTPPKKFKTFAVDQRSVTFIAYGDDRTYPKHHAAVTANFKQYSPEFILHTGDLVASGQRYELWEKEFFGPTADVLDEVPLLPSIGNHESDGKNYLFYMSLPGRERWYSSDLGPVHVLALDFHYDKETDEQFAFAKKDLMNSKAPWKIVFLHFPVFNIGGHNTGWGHKYYLPLFHEARVDMVVTGHSHIYERFRPIAAASGADSWPITHITTGGGGAPLAPVAPHPALVAFYSTNHFTLFEATETTMKVRAIGTNNAVLDSFEMEKKSPTSPATTLAKAYPEEALKFSFEAPASLTPGLASVPSADSPAQAMFIIRPMKTGDQPVQFEIALMPESAPYYQIENGPLRVVAPTLTESNKVVWARVRAIGDRNSGIDGRSGDLLSPPLRFRAKMVFGKEETFAYGQRCRVTEGATEAAKAFEAAK